MSINRRQFWVVFLPALFLAANALATEMLSCPSNHTDVRISRKIQDPQIDYSKDVDMLETMKFRDPLASDRTFARVAALTVAAIAVDSEIRIASTTPAEGEATCAWPSVVTVTLSTAPTVYVGADHGACMRDVGLGHEMQHVAIDRKVIDTYGPIFRRQVGAMVEAMNAQAPPQGLDVQTMRDRIEEKINAIIAVTSDSLNTDRAAQHRTLDSPQEYRRLSMACPQVSIEPSAEPAVIHARINPNSN
jgi:hypothetical protein